jgi:UDP-N-acetylglucosamine/UDP-N-acetylgalactosamine diphosphorylase
MSIVERETRMRELVAAHGQEHVFRFWDQLDECQRTALLAQLEEVDFPLMDRLIATWVHNEPDAEHFSELRPVPVIPEATPEREDAREAWAAGEEALRAGRVGLFLVAGGQGTRLGFDGPKGAYPVGPLTRKTLFQYHAEKILNLQDRFGCTLPWFIMVSDTNGPETRAFFEAHDYFGLRPDQVQFLTQDMVPCVDESGKFILEEPGTLAMNPNGHGGCIPAMVKHGVLRKCRELGVDILSFFQVDNWAVRVADPYFLGYHVLRGAEASSKNHRKREPREPVGVHCICDGEYRVIEYSELDIYPQLLETDAQGNVVFYAGNPAIHQFSVEFIQRVNDHFEEFPWHRAHKKIPFVNEAGETVSPDKPNGYKFETFVFDSLRYASHEPVALEISPEGQYTPIKTFEGSNSVVAARQSMANMWAKWLEAAGANVPRDTDGRPAIQIEISPAFALYQDEFVQKTQGRTWPEPLGDIAIDARGNVER